ncbi:MAG: hypothetical protein WBI12_03420 [Methanosarcina flavescens]
MGKNITKLRKQGGYTIEIKKFIESRKLNYKDFNKLREYGSVLALYVFLTVIFTYPVAFKIKTDIPGMAGDSFQWMRILWYTKIAIFETNLTTLTHDNLLFYPDGIESMPFPSAFNQIMYLLLSPFLELHVIYTILWLLTFIAGAFGCYLLVKYLTGNKYAAFIAGIVFAFSPYHFSRGLYFFGATTIQWIPFCALYLIKTVKEGGIKNPIIAGAFFILVAMSDLQYMVFMGIFTGLVLLYDFYRNLDLNKGFFLSTGEITKKYAAFGIVSFSGILPLTLNEIRISLSSQNFLKPDYSEILKLSNDFMSFFTPSHLHPFLGDFTLDFYSKVPSWLPEKVNFIGYAVLGLSIFAFIKLRKDPDVKFWLFSTLFFSAVSLGPVLMFNGEPLLINQGINLPLPHQILYQTIPFLDNCRTVGRFFVMATLGYAVLAGYSLSELLKHKIRKKSLVFTVISCLIILEYLCIPYPTSSADIPEFYRTIGNDNENYALLELPANTNGGYMNFAYLYYQTVHKKPLVGGYAARYPENVNNFQQNTPFIRELTYGGQYQNDIVREDLAEKGASILNKNNIRYVILHQDQLSREQMDSANNLLKKTLNTEPEVYPEDGLVVYRVQKEEEKLLHSIALKDGWYPLEDWGGTPTRWMSDNATLSIYSDEEKNATLKFQTYSFHRPRTLKIYSGKDLLYTQAINPDYVTVSAPVSLRKGENIIHFNVREGSERPCDIPELNSNDTRELSIIVQKMELL